MKDSFSGKKVLLLFPPLRDALYGEGWRSTESPTPPLGLLYLATPLQKAGYDVTFVDLTVDHLEREAYFRTLMTPDFVLITCYTKSLGSVRRLIRDIRQVNHRARILCGGPYCNETEQHIEGSDVTAFGEADLIIVALLDALRSGEAPGRISGISYTEDGHTIRNPGTLLVEDLDQLEPPALELADGRRYGHIYGVRVGSISGMLTSRGCPFGCTFCTYKRVKYRERSVDSVVSEIQLRAEQGARYVIFYDDNFLLRKDRAIAVMDMIIERGIDIKIALQARVDTADYALYRKLKAGGVIIIIFGIESACQDVLDFYRKQTTVTQNRSAIRMANKVGFITFGNLIIGAPIEGDDHFEANKDFFRKTPLDLISVHILHFVYPSALWMEAHGRGLIRDDELIVPANRSLTGFSYEELLQVQRDFIRSFYNNPRRIIRLVYKMVTVLGLGYLHNLSRMYLGRTIYRSAERFHGPVLQIPGREPIGE
jgi:radical SAM superfamily enzyme YgiQ (UPF0313 family)